MIYLCVYIILQLEFDATKLQYLYNAYITGKGRWWCNASSSLNKEGREESFSTVGLHSPLRLRLMVVWLSVLFRALLLLRDTVRCGILAGRLVSSWIEEYIIKFNQS